MAFRVVSGVLIDIPIVKQMIEEFGAQYIQLPKTEDEIVKQTADADAVIAGHETYSQKVVRSLTKCKVISRLGIGVDNIDVEEATRQGIPVAVVLDASVHEVSDHAISFILVFSRRLFPLKEAVRVGHWKAGGKVIPAIRMNMVRLNHQTLGLVGMGRIGSLVAQKAKAFGLRVLVYDPYLSSEAAAKAGVDRVEFEQILKESDFISLHSPLVPETEKLFGLEELKKMKPTAYLINTSRGGLIDEKALYQAITEGYIAGAGLDVTDPEPPGPENPLLKLDQVMVTGHSAWFSKQAMYDLQKRTAEAAIMGLQDKWPPHLANPEVKQQGNRRIP